MRLASSRAAGSYALTDAPSASSRRTIDIAQRGAEVGDFVREGNRRGEEAVRRVLDHFGGTEVGAHSLDAVKGRVQVLERRETGLVERAEDEAIGTEKVPHGFSLSEEF